MPVSFEWQLGVFGSPLGSKQLNRAITRAVAKAGSDAARTMRTAATADVRARKRLKVSRIRKSLALDFPTSRSTLSALSWRMRVGNAPVPVGDLAPRQTKRGVSFSINVGKRSLIEGAFIATMNSGHTGVFFRTSRSRLPIKEAFTTRVSDVFGDHDFVPGVFAKSMTKFQASFDRLLPLELAKLKP